MIVLLIQAKVGMRLQPFFLVWGLLLTPTVLVWTALVMALHTITQNRYTPMLLALAVLCFTGYRALTNQINWVGNWPLWSAVPWSDISVLELDRKGHSLEPAIGSGPAVFLVVLALAFFRRREWDPSRLVQRLSPRALSRVELYACPLAGRPACMPASGWHWQVSWGHDGGAAKKQEKDYWRKNMATYRDARIPDTKHVDLELELFPEQANIISRENTN